MGEPQARFSANDEPDREVLAEVRTRHGNFGALTIRAVDVLWSGHGTMTRLPDPSKLDVVQSCHRFELSLSTSEPSIPQFELLHQH